MKIPGPSTVAWGLVFLGWFWLDDWFLDPASLKELLLPVGLTAVLLTSRSFLPSSRSWAIGILPIAWALVRIGDMASPSSVWLGLWVILLAFVVGVGGVRPPLWMVLGALSLAVLRGWVDVLTGQNLGGGIPGTITSFFVHKNFFGLILGPALLLLLDGLRTAQIGFRLRLWGWVLGLVGGGLFVLVQSRGAQVGFLLGLAVISASWLRRARAGVVRWGVVVILLAGGGLFALAAQERIVQATEEASSLLSGEVVRTEIPTRFRPWVWQGTLDLWRSNPWIGCGTGDYGFEIESRVQPWTDVWRERGVRIGVAHSHWLHVLAEKGVIGLALEFGLFALAMVVAFLRKDRGVLAALLAMGCHGMVAEGFEYATGGVLLWWCTGFALRESTGHFPQKWMGWALGAVLLVPLGMRAMELHGEYIFRKSLAAPPPARGRMLVDALEASPRDWRILMELARVQAEAGDQEGAIATLFHLRSLYPVANAVFMERPLSGAFLAAGKPDEALQVLGDGLRLYPYDPGLLEAWLGAVEVRWGCQVRLRARDSLAPNLDRIFALPKIVPEVRSPSQSAAWVSFRRAASEWAGIRRQGCRDP